MKLSLANDAIGFPKFKIINVSNVHYRQVIFDTPCKQQEFNCLEWENLTDTSRELTNIIQLENDITATNATYCEASTSSTMTESNFVTSQCIPVADNRIKIEQGNLISNLNTTFENNIWSGYMKVSTIIESSSQPFSDTLNHIETQTGTTISSTPSVNISSPRLTLTIRSVNLSDVQFAATLIESMNTTVCIPNTLAEKKPNFTHFISLPITDSHLIDQYERFCRQANDNNYKYTEKKLFQKTERLHMTICMLTLPTDEEITRCCNIMNNLQGQLFEASNKQKLTIEFGGLDILTEDSTDVSVIVTKPCGPVDCLNRLHMLCRLFIETLVSERVLTLHDLEQQRLIKSDGKTISVQLHMTLMNRKFVHKGPMNATKILEDFKSFKFGNGYLNEVHLSVLGPVSPQTKYYKCLCRCNLS